MCKKQLGELQELRSKFEERGIGVVAISGNSRDLAEKSVAEWGLEGLTVGYGLSREDADRWGLFLSSAIKDGEPDVFVEPGLFVVRADGTLYASIVQTMPFSRPPLSKLLETLEYVIEKEYPARGELACGVGNESRPYRPLE